METEGRYNEPAFALPQHRRRSSVGFLLGCLTVSCLLPAVAVLQAEAIASPMAMPVRHQLREVSPMVRIFGRNPAYNVKVSKSRTSTSAVKSASAGKVTTNKTPPSSSSKSSTSKVTPSKSPSSSSGKTTTPASSSHGTTTPASGSHQSPASPSTPSSSSSKQVSPSTPSSSSSKQVSPSTPSSSSSSSSNKQVSPSTPSPSSSSNNQVSPSTPSSSSSSSNQVPPGTPTNKDATSSSSQENTVVSSNSGNAGIKAASIKQVSNSNNRAVNVNSLNDFASNLTPYLAPTVLYLAEYEQQQQAQAPAQAEAVKQVVVQRPTPTLSRVSSSMRVSSSSRVSTSSRVLTSSAAPVVAAAAATTRSSLAPAILSTPKPVATRITGSSSSPKVSAETQQQAAVVQSPSSPASPSPTSFSSVFVAAAAATPVSSKAPPNQLFNSIPPRPSATPTPTPLPGQANDNPSKVKDATNSDVFRYRYQYGANMGSVWVMERWLFPGMFPNGTAANLTSELESVKAWVNKVGISQAQGIFEAHWADAIEDKELDFIVNQGLANSLRMPVGFFTLGPTYCKGTPFESIGAVYTNAWSYVKQAIAKANAVGIGVLIDFHALPGGANVGEHSGTNSGEADLWSSTDYLALAQDALNFIVREARTIPGVIGVQVVNEAIYDAPGMYAWYDKLLAGFNSIDNTMPIYISDGWDLPTAISYAKGKNVVGTSTNPTVIDTHLYWAFTQADWDSSPQQLIAQVPSALDSLNGKQGGVIPNGAVDVVVGEYSDVFDDSTWAKRGNASIQDLTIQFGVAQNKMHRLRAGGEFFWSTKMDPNLHYGGWCFGVQTTIKAINPPNYMTLGSSQVTNLLAQANSKKNDTMQAAYNSHVAYWNQTAPQMQFEHWRYMVGWQMGYNDSASFWNMRTAGRMGTGAPGGDRIGLLDLWTKKRITESGMQGNYVWEFEQGFRKGVADFGSLTGAY